MEAIHPKVDLAFKKIFGVEENKDLTISLINSIVSDEDQVQDITILNPYNPKNFLKDKLSILDIKAKGHNNKLFNIEMQVSDEADYDKRALYYWARLYTQQLKESSKYDTLAKTIGIHILNFNSIPNANTYHSAFHITEKTTGVAHFKDLELHTIELSKFEADMDAKSADMKDFVKNLKTALDIWSSFLTRHNLLNPKDVSQHFDDPGTVQNLEKALGVLSHINLSDEEREIYESRLDFIRFEDSAIRKAEEKGMEKGMEKGIKKGIEKGRVEGREEGMAEGMEKGREEGIEKGREEGIEKGKEEEKLRMAEVMLLQGISIEVISTVTDLSIDDIKKIKPMG